MYDKGYYLYLQSPLWRENRRKAEKKRGKVCILGKEKGGIEWHHLTYEFIWTTDDYDYIIPVCRTHHHRLHFHIRNGQKIPLVPSDLQKRYRVMRLWFLIGRWRPSDFFSIFGRF
jgi:hypothetical protein